MTAACDRKRFSNVLIVEDDDAQRSTLSDILEQEGFKSITASNAKEALEHTRKQNFGVAILDFRLPDISGTELLERIHAINHGVRVIIHTGYGSFDSAKDAVNQGAFAYVEKAGDPVELLRHVHRAIQSQYDKYAGDLEADVAERTASLGESEERYRSLVELSPDGVALQGRNGLIYANPRSARLLGAAGPEALIGRKLSDFASSDQRARIEESLHRILIDKSSAEIGEIRILNKGMDETILEVRGNYIVVSGNPVVQLLIRDVTQANKSEEMRRTLEARMRETQKMEIAGQLAAGIAHDFNNLLTVILGSTELLRERIMANQAPTDVHRSLIEQIDGAGQRAAALTARLLTFSRRQPVRLELANVNSVIRDIEHLLRGVLGETIQLIVRPSSKLPAVQADVSQLEQVIMNFAINARDAMPNGGTFTLATEYFAPTVEFAANHPDLPKDDMVRLRAIDTGTGMTPEIRSRIFEPFFTTKPSGKGTGLGLPTVYGIVRQAGGWIDVFSEPNKGTAFDVYWPAVGAQTSESRMNGSTDVKPGAGTILLCEDDDVVRQVTVHMLRRRGYTVISAASGDEALRLVQENGDKIDLLLSDIIMPEIQGVELARRVRANYPSMGVILMSGCATDEIRPIGEVGSGFPVLQKPFSSEKLLEVIATELKIRAPKK